MRSSCDRAGGVERFERDEDGTGARRGQWTPSRREPVSRLANTRRRPGGGPLGLGPGRRLRALRAMPGPLPKAIRFGPGGGKGGALTLRARAGGARSALPGAGPRAGSGGCLSAAWGLLGVEPVQK